MNSEGSKATESNKTSEGSKTTECIRSQTSEGNNTTEATGDLAMTYNPGDSSSNKFESASDDEDPEGMYICMCCYVQCFICT